MYCIRGGANCGSQNICFVSRTNNALNPFFFFLRKIEQQK